MEPVVPTELVVIEAIRAGQFGATEPIPISSVLKLTRPLPDGRLEYKRWGSSTLIAFKPGDVAGQGSLDPIGHFVRPR